MLGLAISVLWVHPIGHFCFKYHILKCRFSISGWIVERMVCVMQGRSHGGGKTLFCLPKQFYNFI